MTGWCPEPAIGAVLYRDLPSLHCCNLQWKTLLAHEVYIVIEDTAKVDKIVCIKRLYSIVYLFLIIKRKQERID